MAGEENYFNDRRGKYFLWEYFWCTSHLIFRSCDHRSRNCQLHAYIFPHSSQCLAIITSLSASVRAFFVFLFFSSFSLQFSLLVSIARDIFSFSHELRVLSYSLTYSVYISHAKRQAIVGWVSLSCDQDGGMKTIKLRVLLAHVED